LETIYVQKPIMNYTTEYFPYACLFEPGQTLHILPQDIVEGLLKGIDTVLSEFDLLSLLVEFAGSLRGDHSLEFKIANIIKALEISEWVRELETKKRREV